MKKEIDGKIINIYVSDELSAPIVISCDVEDGGAELLKECESLGCPAFHLVTISNLRWDEKLSPWAHEAIIGKDDHFSGGADDYLSVLEKEILSYVKEVIPGNQAKVLHGYSMGGLFALYAAHKSGYFDAYAAPSASVWYPDFVQYVTSHEFAKKPKAIYLSLGDKESRSKNQYLSQTENNMQALYDYYESQGIEACFELNQGNHFKDVTKRMAKAICWSLERV